MTIDSHIRQIGQKKSCGEQDNLGRGNNDTDLFKCILRPGNATCLRVCFCADIVEVEVDQRQENHHFKFRGAHYVAEIEPYNLRRSNLRACGMCQGHPCLKT
jgi:hypothetical protein